MSERTNRIQNEGGDDSRRFPGVRSFGEADAGRFFGRETVAEELLLRVLSVRLLLQFAPSGVGKTSVLQAGLFPLLRPHGFFPLIVRLNRADESLTAAFRRSLAEAAAAYSLPDPVIPVDARDALGLLAGTRLWSDELSLLTPVLVFDQFEEVFTLRDETFRRGFAQDIGVLAGARPRGEDLGGNSPPGVKIIISLREEFLGRLDEFSAEIPDLFQERLRLAPLSHEEARHAMVKPSGLDGDSWASPKFEFESGCLGELLDFIDGASEKSRVIEPLTLQLVCRHAETQVIEARDRGDAARALVLSDFGGIEGLRNLVADHFKLEISKLPDAASRRRALELFEQGMLDPAGKRLMLEEGEIERDHHLDRAALDQLVEGRLLRREPRNESLFYEISHDRLAEAIARQRKVKLPKWVVPVLAGSMVMVIVACVVAGFVYYEQAQTRAALRESEKAYGLLLGESLVSRLVDAGAADALKNVLDRIEEKTAASQAPPAVMKLRHQADLLFDRATLAEARSKINEAMQTLGEASTSRRPEPPAVLGERARLLGRLGEIESEAGRLALAQQRYDAAAALWDSVLKGDPTPIERMEVAELYKNRAILARRQGDYVAAEGHVAASLEVAVQAWMATHADLRNGTKNMSFEQGRSIQILADATLEKANIWYGEQFAAAAAMAQEAQRMRPFSTRALVQLMTAKAVLGQHTRGQEQQPQAQELAEAALQIDKLILFDPDQLHRRRDQAAVRLIAADKVADCAERPTCAKVNGPDAVHLAQLEVQETTGDLRWLASVDLERQSWRADIAWALTVQARLQATTGDSAAAIKLLDEALAQYRAVRSKDVDYANIDLAAGVLMLRAHLLAGMGQADQALATMAEAFKEIEPLPTTMSATTMTLSNLLDQQAAVLDRLGRKTEAKMVKARWAETVAKLGTPWMMSATRATAANKKAVELIDGAQKLSGTPALQSHREAVRYYLEAIKDNPSEPVYWANLGDAFGRIATELGNSSASAQTPVQGSAPMPASATSLTENQASALAAAVSAVSVAHALSAEDKKAARQQLLYEARRSLALFYRDHDSAPLALALARDGVFQSREMIAGTRDSPQALEQLRDAYYGLGLMRFETSADGWEESIRVALEHGKKLGLMQPKDASHPLWLGEVHAYLGGKLREKGRPDAAAMEFRLAVAECRSELLLDQSVRQRANACIDSVPPELR